MANSININAVRDPDLIAKLNAICEKKKPIAIGTLAKQILHESADRQIIELGIELTNTQSAIAG